MPLKRQLHMGIDASTDPRWHRRLPELAAVANAVSLLMPHVEPMVVRAMSAGAEQVAATDPDLAGRVRAAAAQEAGHHRQHRTYNQALAARYGLRRIEGWMGLTARWLDRRPLPFRVAFTAGFETVAFATARWVDRRAVHHFDGVDSPAATMFLWHLAEEVEHRDIAEDLHRAMSPGHGGRLRHAAGMISALIILGWFTILGVVRLLAVDRRLLHPVATIRLMGWGLSFAFEALPMATVACIRGGTGPALADPPWLRAWLDGTDPSAGTIAAFAADLRGAGVPGRPSGSDHASARHAAAMATTAAARVNAATGLIDQRS